MSGSRTLLTAAIVLYASAAFGAERTLAESAVRVVKLYGAGGAGRLEGFASGVACSPDGLIVTVLSPMLDARNLRAVLWDGRRLPARLAGVDPKRELAALRVEAADLPSFDLNEPAAVEPGDVVWAISNLYNIASGAEPPSVQRGVASAVASLTARKGVVELTYPGDVYILDAITNNPGAAGGALVDARGRLAGVLGKDVRAAGSNTWINFAVPAADVAQFLQRVRTGAAPATLPHRDVEEVDRREQAGADLRGIRTLPDAFDRTPAYIDEVEPDSPAASIGLAPDDLILLVDETLIQTLKDVRAAMAAAPSDEPVEITILRGEALLKLTLPPRKGSP